MLCTFALSKLGKQIMKSIGQALEVSSKDLVKRQQIEHALTELQNNATAVEVNVGSVETALQTVIDCAKSLSQPANILDARACLVQCDCFWVFENGSALMKTNKDEQASAFSECGPAYGVVGGQNAVRNAAPGARNMQNASAAALLDNASTQATEEGRRAYNAFLSESLATKVRCPSDAERATSSIAAIAGQLLARWIKAIKPSQESDAILAQDAVAAFDDLQQQLIDMKAFARVWNLWHTVGKWEVAQGKVPDTIAPFFDLEVASSARLRRSSNQKTHRNENNKH